MLAEQGVAPGSLRLRKQRPGRLGPPPAPPQTEGLPFKGWTWTG